MKIGSFRGRPSKTHLLWSRKAASGSASKRFDDKLFRKWTEHHGFDFDKQMRIDHDRADESRTQFRCVFAWGRRKGKEVEIGDREVKLGSQKAPKTFIEIDEAGLARVKAGSVEEVYNIVEMRYDGAALLIKTASGEKKKVDGKKLSRA